MAFFLLKTEPAVYSFDDLVREGETVWDGVTNNLALKNIRSMKQGDLCFIYHSGTEKAIVGVAEVVKSGYPDPKEHDNKLAAVRIRTVRRLATPVALSTLKKVNGLADFDLIRLPRLSVMGVPEKVWNLILKMSKEE